MGKNSALPVLLESLQRLEYRGYDSCGVALQEGSDIRVVRTMGAVDRLMQIVPTSISGAYAGIGHTRWATNGRAELANAHPLSSCDGGIVAVHNGIIENADRLRHELVAQGHTFRSETDSEVIPHWLEEQVRGGRSMEEAFLELPERLHGTFAIIALERGTDRLLVVRRGSPLVIGVGEGEYYPASDVPSFLARTSRVLYLREGDCFSVQPTGVFQLRPSLSGGFRLDPAPEAETVNLDVDDLSKGDFDHYMIKEIMEQSQVLERLIVRPPSTLERAIALVRPARQIYLIGAGTSYHSALYGEYALSTLTRRHARATIATEFDTVADVIGPEDTVLAISQSGETADTLEAASQAKARKARIVALTNAPLSSLGRLAEVTVPLESGVEFAVASTKTYAATLTLLCSIASALGGVGDWGRSSLWAARDGLIALSSDAARAHSRELGTEILGAKSVFLLGRGLARVTAMEAALKLKEVAGLRAEAFAAGEMKHGPLALVDSGTVAILFYDEGRRTAAEASANELASRGARIISVGSHPLLTSSNHVRVPDTGLATPIPQMLPMQVLAYEIARLQGMDPDRPRNLAKAVTVP